MLKTKEVQQNVSSETKSPKVQVEDINNVLSDSKENCQDGVKSSLDKFFADSNASMMGGWT